MSAAGTGLPARARMGLSPRAVAWAGTFVSAACSLALQGAAGEGRLHRRRLFVAALRMLALGPGAGYVLQRLSAPAAVLVFVMGSAALPSADELEALNNVVWLRCGSVIWSRLPRRGVDMCTHAFIMGTFFGCIQHPDISQRSIVRMTTKFMSRGFFEDMRGRSYQRAKEMQTIGVDSVKVKGSAQADMQGALTEARGAFQRAFVGLFVYNYSLHYAAAIISTLVRSLGSKSVQGVALRKSAPDPVAILRQATKEATILNVGVALSCALWSLGSRTGGMWFGLFCAPLPLHFISPRVRDTTFFLFLPWFTRFMCRLFEDGGELLNPRVRLLSGVALLEGLLKQVAEDDHETFAWMVSVAFQLAQKLAGNIANF